MANSNFIVQNGLTVGPLTIDAASGNITTSGVISSTNTISPTTFSGNVTINGNLTVANISYVNQEYVTNSEVIGTDLTVVGNLWIGPGANSSAFLNPIIIGIDSGAGYVQSAIVNTLGNASADFTAYANNGTDVQGWMDMGMTGNVFNDSRYTITGFNDGYIFANGVTGNSSLGGNLVIATGSGGATNDIVFATGGFLAANEKLRFANASNSLIPFSNAAASLGSSTKWFANVWAATFRGTAITAQYADLAENYLADADYAPGTVVVFGGDKEITITNTTHDTRVAGVVSTNPAYLMNSGQQHGTPVAFTGRVPCRVMGPVTKGQLLVQGMNWGIAEALNPDYFAPGCVLGKALEEIVDNSIQTIEIVVGRF